MVTFHIGLPALAHRSSERVLEALGRSEPTFAPSSRLCANRGAADYWVSPSFVAGQRKRQGAMDAEGDTQ